MQKNPGKRAPRMTLLEAAESALKKTGHPMHSWEIVQYATRRGWIAVRGKTPEKSVQSAISKHVKKTGTASIIRRIGNRGLGSKYGLGPATTPKGRSA
jgi:hypothetical protein